MKAHQASPPRGGHTAHMVVPPPLPRDLRRPSEPDLSPAGCPVGRRSAQGVLDDDSGQLKEMSNRFGTDDQWVTVAEIVVPGKRNRPP